MSALPRVNIGVALIVFSMRGISFIALYLYMPIKFLAMSCSSVAQLEGLEGAACCCEVRCHHRRAVAGLDIQKMTFFPPKNTCSLHVIYDYKQIYIYIC